MAREYTEVVPMSKKGQIQALMNPAVGSIVLVVLLAALAYSFWPDGSVAYPHVPSTYDYEKFHMQTARDIIARVPDGYVDNQYFVEGRTWSFVQANLIFYENRGELEFLDNAVETLEKIRARASDSDNDGLLDFGEYYVHDGNLITHGYLMQLFADTSHVIRKHDVKKYAELVDEYDDLVDKHLIPYYLKYWVAYDVSGEERGYFKHELSGNRAAPYNQPAAGAAAILRRGLDTQNEDYVEIAERYINRFFSVNEVKTYEGTSYISAKYYIYDADSPEERFQGIYDGFSDMSHLNAEFNFIIFAYESGLVSEHELGLITSALEVMKIEAKVGSRSGPVFNWNMNPPRLVYADEPLNLFEQSGKIYNMVRFGIGAEDLVYDFEEILRNLEIDGRLQGDFYSSYYKCVVVPADQIMGSEIDKEFCSGNPVWVYRVEDMSVLLGIANLGRYQRNNMFLSFIGGVL